MRSDVYPEVGRRIKLTQQTTLNPKSRDLGQELRNQRSCVETPANCLPISTDPR
jgi:hypothetical protein